MEGFLVVLANQSPLVVLLVVIGTYMYKHFRDQIKVINDTVISKDIEIKELNTHAREDGLANLKILTEMSHLMEGIIDKQTEGTITINTAIKDEAAGLKEFVDQRVFKKSKDK